MWQQLGISNKVITYHTFLTSALVEPSDKGPLNKELTHLINSFVKPFKGNIYAV